jgi:hypothetical protein
VCSRHQPTAGADSAIPTCDYCSYEGPWPCPRHASPYAMDTARPMPLYDHLCPACGLTVDVPGEMHPECSRWP